MSTSVLAVIAVAQAIFLGLLVVLLVGHRLLGGIRRRRTRRRTVLANQSAGRWLAGQLDDAAFLAVLDRLSFAEVSYFLQRLSAQMGGDDWERLAVAVRSTSWFSKVHFKCPSRVWWSRLQAAQALTIVAAEEDIPLIEALVRDEHPAVRRAAVWCLRRVQSPRLAGFVLDLAIREPRVTRGQILEILAGNRRHLLASLVIRLRTSEDAEELCAVLALAALVGVPGILPHILPHTVSSLLEVRIAAARALAAYPHLHSSHALVAQLGDPAWQVRAQAAAGLGAIGALEAVCDLDQALTDPSWWVRLRSALALRRLGTAGTRLLEQRRPESDQYAYEMARYVLELDAAAVAEYSGPAAVDYTEAPVPVRAA